MDYHSKYLKYKQKYINLKKEIFTQIGGGRMAVYQKNIINSINNINEASIDQDIIEDTNSFIKSLNSMKYDISTKVLDNNKTNFNNALIIKMDEYIKVINTASVDKNITDYIGRFEHAYSNLQQGIDDKIKKDYRERFDSVVINYNNNVKITNEVLNSIDEMPLDLLKIIAEYSQIPPN